MAPKGKKKALQPCAAGAAQQDAGGEKHEDGRWDDMHRGEHGVEREGCVERRHLRGPAVRGMDQCVESPGNDGHGDNYTEPESRQKP
jgi:hypothetical protein